MPRVGFGWLGLGSPKPNLLPSPSSTLPISSLFDTCLQDDGLAGLYVIQKGQVRITFDSESIRSRNASSLMSEYQNQDDYLQNDKDLSLEKSEGSYFGEWTLLSEHIDSLSATAVGDVVCAVLTKEKFDSVVGPLAKLSQDDYKYVVIFFLSGFNYNVIHIYIHINWG